MKSVQHDGKNHFCSISVDVTPIYGPTCRNIWISIPQTINVYFEMTALLFTAAALESN